MATKSFIKTIGGKGLLADYNTEGKKLQTEESIDQTYSSTSTKAQSGVAVNEALKTRETSSKDDSYTYLGMSITNKGTENLYWKLVSFKPSTNFWTLQFEIDVANGRKGDKSFDTEIYETKRLTIYGYNVNSVSNAIELRYIAQEGGSSRGYGNNIYYEMDGTGLVTVYIYALNSANYFQTCRLTNVMNFQGISNITWHEATADAGTQPTNPVKFKEVFPAIASTISNVGSDSVPVYVNKGKPVVCNSSNLKAGKDDDGNVIKNTYATKTELSTHTNDTTVHITAEERTAWNAKQAALTAGDLITIANNVISAANVLKPIDISNYQNKDFNNLPSDNVLYYKNSSVNFENQPGYGSYRFIQWTSSAYYSVQIAIDSNNRLFSRSSYRANPGDTFKTWNPWIKFQAELTFDTTPTAGSTNPVTSDGIKTALDSRIPAPTSTTGTQVLKCIDGVVQWVADNAGSFATKEYVDSMLGNVEQLLSEL